MSEITVNIFLASDLGFVKIEFQISLTYLKVFPVSIMKLFGLSLWTLLHVWVKEENLCFIFSILNPQSCALKIQNPRQSHEEHQPPRQDFFLVEPLPYFSLVLLL